MPPKRKAAAATEESSSPVFDDLVFAISGKLSCSQGDMKKKIEGAGGSFASSITKKVTHVVCSDEAASDGNEKVAKAQEQGLFVVSEAFVDDSIKKGKKLSEADYDQLAGKSKSAAKEEEDEEEEEDEKPAPKKAARAAPKRGAASKKKAAEPEEEEDEEEEEKPAPKKAARAAPKRAAASKKKAAEPEEEEEEEEEEAPVEKKPAAKKAKVEEKSDESNIKTITVHKKGKAPVDSLCGLAASYHVVESDGVVYDVMLNQTNINANNNKFYVLQALEKDGGGSFAVWTRWGRVGANGMNKTENFNSIAACIKGFEKKFKEKTKNEWSNRANFKKVAGKYDMIEMDHGNDGEEEVDDDLAAKLAANQKARANTASKLDPRVQELVKLLFDIKMFESTLMEMKLDVKKMPLGKISKAQIKKGYAILEEAEALFKKSDKPSHDELERICSKFYTTIPHHFGMQKPPLIKTKEELQQKMDLLEVLGDMEVAQKMLEKESKVEAENPIDSKYKQLNNDIVPVDKKSEEWQRIENYIENTRQHYQFELMDVYKINRHGESETFAENDKIEHRKLLWHGSKVAVFAAILSTGLRIMPHSGGRVGRGLYFADILAKSASYCGLHNNVGLLLLNEVALGKIHEITRDDPSLVVAPKGFNSVLACGTQAPDAKAEYVDKELSNSGNPVVIPQGKIGNTKISSSFLHNEYLVYDAKQVNMKYLLMMRWKNYGY